MGQFSITAVKRVKRMNKDQLVDMVINLNNYAENQKAQNIILLKMVEDYKIELAKYYDEKSNDVKFKKEKELK